MGQNVGERRRQARHVPRNQGQADTGAKKDLKPMEVRESGLTSLRVGLNPTVLKNKTQVSALAKNPGDNGGESNVVKIDVSAPGG
jgi:hypothetical protein